MILTTKTAGTSNILSDPYWDSVVVYSRFNARNDGYSSFCDLSKYQRPIRRINTNTIPDTSVKKFGYSAYYTSSQTSAAYLATDDGQLSHLNFGTNDFTIEMWVNLANLSATSTLCGQTSALSWILNVTTSGTLSLITSSTTLTSTSTISTGAWHHIAVTRSSGVVNFWIDGVLDASSTTISTLNVSTSNNFGIGGNQSGTNASTAACTTGFNIGRIDEFRITNGVARYTSNFTVPTASFPVNQVVSFCQTFDNSYSDSSFVQQTFTGSGTIAYAAGKAGVTTKEALVFDGSTTYLYNNAAPLNNIFNEDGTLELNVKFNSLSGTQHILEGGQSTTNRFLLYLNSSKINFSVWQTSSSQTFQIIGPTTITTGVWYHLAIAKKGNIFTLFINGVKSGTGTITSPIFCGVGQAHVGFQAFGGGVGSDHFNGVIDDIRATSNAAIYTEQFTVPATSLTASTGTSSYDPYWDSVTLLLKFIGAGDTTSSFVDQSKKQRIIRRTGGGDGTVVSDPSYPIFGHSSFKSTQQTSAAYISTSDPGSLTSDLGSFGTGDFTVEAWIYPISTPAASTTYGICGQTGAVSWIFNFIAGGYLTVGRNSTTILTSNVALTTGSWHHVAFVRSSGVSALYQDGVRIVTATDTATYTLSTTNNFGIGGNNTGTSTATTATGSGFSIGRIGELRITNGVARYTGAAYTVPSSSFPTMPVTTLVLRGESSLADGGSRRVPMSGTNSYGSPKFGSNSLTFSGTQYQYTAVGYAGGNDIFVEDGTVECWVLFTSLANAPHVFEIGYDVSNRFGVFLNSGVLTFFSIQSNWTSNVNIAGPTATTNTWYHVAVVKRGSTYSFFVNGVLYGSAVRTPPLFLGSGSAYIGYQPFSGGSIEYLQGRVDDFRMVMNKAVYTESFTVPSAQVSNQISPSTDLYWGNVGLLCHFNDLYDNGIYNRTITAVGSAAVSTVQKKFGTASLLLNGTSQYVSVGPANAAINDLCNQTKFTVEGWIYLSGNSPTNGASLRRATIVDGGSQSGSNPSSWNFSVEGSSTTTGTGLYFEMLDSTSTLYTASCTVSISTASWHHVAVVRNGSTITFYLDGVAQTTSTNTIGSTTFAMGAQLMYIGGRPLTSYQQYFNGYIDEVRITNNAARTITVPTAAYPDGNGS